LAALSIARDYVRPSIDESGVLQIEDGRHPVVEQLVAEPFVPNDLHLDSKERQILLLTGPNMGGKSTYLRQAALLVVMAQMGSFVPARRARIGLVDRLFTRVGASDNLARGQSTFLVEMAECAKILRGSTDQSLVILDEVGRGTSTDDGLALAWAITEYLHDGPVRPKSLFATHFHELTELSGRLPRLANIQMEVRDWQGKILFLHKVIAGAGDRSYGIHVAESCSAREPCSKHGDATRRRERRLPAPPHRRGSNCRSSIPPKQKCSSVCARCNRRLYARSMPCSFWPSSRNGSRAFRLTPPRTPKPFCFLNFSPCWHPPCCANHGSLCLKVEGRGPDCHAKFS
jgi:DNA mismatch repair protein MutS